MIAYQPKAAARGLLALTLGVGVAHLGARLLVGLLLGSVSIRVSRDFRALLLDLGA